MQFNAYSDDIHTFSAENEKGENIWLEKYGCVGVLATYSYIVLGSQNIYITSMQILANQSYFLHKEFISVVHGCTINW